MAAQYDFEFDADAEPVEPQPKRHKNESIFQLFLKDERRMEKLRHALADIKIAGSVEAQMSFRKVAASNAREPTSFSKASCLLNFIERPGFIPAGIFFIPAIDILEKYCCEDMIPKDKDLQDVLAKLLEYLSSGHGALLYKESQKQIERDYGRNWIVVIAQHLLSKLALNDEYIIDGFLHQHITQCLSEQKDDIIGRFADTSFGCSEAWHGRADVILEVSNLTVRVQEESNNLLEQMEEEKDTNSDRFDETEHRRSEEMHITAQTIVFSFLQRKYDAVLNNYLVPGISIGTNSYEIVLYDSEEDVLVTTLPEAKMFSDINKELKYTVTVLLWMTLNNRYFCSGVPRRSKKFQMKDIKSGFFERVGDLLLIYQEKVMRPAPPSPICKSRPQGEGCSMAAVLLPEDMVTDLGFKKLNMSRKQAGK